MTGLFSTALDNLKGLFSRAFWFGAFLPVAIFATLHVLIAYLHGLKGPPLWDWIENLGGADLVPLTVALIVIAFVVRPMIPVLRGLLDGRLLPEWLHDELREPRRMKAEEARAAVKAARKLFVDYQLDRPKVVERLGDAFRSGNSLKDVSNKDAIKTAEDKIGEFREALNGRVVPSISSQRAVFDALEVALKSNDSELKDTQPDAAWSRRLAEAHREVLRLLQKAEEEARYRHAVCEARNAFAELQVPEATRVGDARALTERYPLRVYGVNFDYLWPRLQLVIPEKTEELSSQRFSEAQAQVDFAVLSLSLSLTLFAWLPILAIRSDSPWLFLTVGLALPLLILFLFELVVESQTAFGEVIKAAIDKHRLEVLAMLRMPAPAWLSTERELWASLRRAEQRGDLFDLAYDHEQPQVRQRG